MRGNAAAPRTAAREGVVRKPERLFKSSLQNETKSGSRSTGERAVVASVVAGALAFAMTAQTSDLFAEPFKPVRELTTWYTDRTPIDIEIIGSTSMLPQFHHLEPERTLRFRLERAYVGILLAKDEPGFEIVHFSFDMETGLPESLFLQWQTREDFTRTSRGFRFCLSWSRSAGR